MPGEDHPTIMKMYVGNLSFQTTKQAGMGIGAYESFQYVQELGGRIEVDSEVNKGTTVTIRLPLFETHKTSDLHSLEAK